MSKTRAREFTVLDIEQFVNNELDRLFPEENYNAPHQKGKASFDEYRNSMFAAGVNEDQERKSGVN